MKLTKRKNQLANPFQVKTEIAETLSKSRSENTLKCYAGDVRQFKEFCAANDLESFPASVQTLVVYVNHIKDRYKLSTIERKIASIVREHKKMKLARPTDSDDYQEYMKGLRNQKRDEGKKQAKAVRKNDLVQICKDLVQKDSPKAIRDRVILVVGWFGAFRRSELANLKWSDLEKDEAGYRVNIRHSKTDQEGKGKYKGLPYKSDIAICPVRALDQLREIVPGEFVFPAMTAAGKITKDQTTDKAIYNAVKKYLGADFSAHGLRAGFVTQAAMQGATAEQIAVQTGHKHMPTLLEYIRPLNIWEGNAVMNL